MAIPFKLEFIQESSKPQIVQKFASNEYELFKLNDDEIPVVKENLSLNLVFSSDNSSDRLYFDLLDIVFKNDRQEALTYISPSGEPLNIYDSNSNYTGALIPGYYKIIINHGNEKYYTWLKIVPKQMTEEQWIVMREEVEAELTGLARGMIYKRTGTRLDNDSPLPLNLINKIELIIANFNQWKMAFHHISKSPRFRLKKDYKKVNKSEARFIDPVSLRKMQSDAQTHSRGQVFTSVNVCSYDTLENRWLKFYITNILKHVLLLFKQLNKYITDLEESIKKKMKYKNTYLHDLQYNQMISTKVDLQSHRYKLTSIINDCNLFLNEDWVNTIENSRPFQNSLVIQSDSNYRAIYRFYKDIIAKNYQIILSTEYTYYWKRTDLLFEIWGYIQFIKAFTSEKIGFEIQQGWIYNAPLGNNSFEIPFLKSNTIVEMIKDDLQVNLVYDFKVSKNDEKQLLYTDMRANRPDLRLDFYKTGEYINSIIVDFKYRPLKNIWSKHGLTDVMEQLIMYRDNFYSQHVYAKSFPGNWENFRAVKEVWAVYPNHHLNNLNGEPRQIRLVELTPNLPKDAFLDILSDSISSVLRAYHSFLRK